VARYDRTQLRIVVEPKRARAPSEAASSKIRKDPM
jgi:hypothetical protein